MAPNTVTVTLEKPESISLIELNDSGTKSVFQEKQKATSTKQLTWVLFLKLNKLFSVFPWVFTSLWKISGSVRTRITSSDPEDPRYRGRLYRAIKVFLGISVVALMIEVFAYFNKWDLSYVNVMNPWDIEQNVVQWCYMAWLSFRVDYIAPFVVGCSKFCIVLFMIQSLDRFVQCLGCFWIKFKGLKPEVIEDELDVEDGLNYPMVLVQIPMCNEKEVKK